MAIQPEPHFGVVPEGYLGDLCTYVPPLPPKVALRSSEATDPLGLLPPVGGANEGVVDRMRQRPRRGHDDHDPTHPSALVDAHMGQVDVLEHLCLDAG